MCIRCCDRQTCLSRWRVWFRPLVMFCYGVVLIVVLPFLVIRLQELGAHPHDKAWFIGGVFVLMTLPMSIWGITQHLVHYTKPHLQKHILRILWMVPIYALDSWLALLFPEYAIYMDTCRECYEAYVIYNFMIFLLNYLHIESGLAESLVSKPPAKHFFPLCCLPPWKMGSTVVERCKHGILQYAVVRPVTTVIALICEMVGVYHEGEFKANAAYPYLVSVNNLSQFVAMYSLIFFYKAHYDELAPMNPLGKFLCIKSVVFFSFFQSVIISILVNTGVISESFTTKDDKVIKAVASSLQDFLICIEMFLAAVAHLYAFTYKPYVVPDNESPSCWESFLSMWDVSDVRRDVSDHIRAVGSTVQRSVVRRQRTTNAEPDEHTRLLQSTRQESTSELVSKPLEDQQQPSSFRSNNSLNQKAGDKPLQRVESVDDNVDISGPMERSLIDFSADPNC